MHRTSAPFRLAFIGCGKDLVRRARAARAIANAATGRVKPPQRKQAHHEKGRWPFEKGSRRPIQSSFDHVDDPNSPLGGGPEGRRPFPASVESQGQIARLTILELKPGRVPASAFDVPAGLKAVRMK